MKRIEELRELAKGPIVDMASEVDRHAAAIKALMEAMHGGRWFSHIDHDAGLVMVAIHSGQAPPNIVVP